MKLIDTRQQIEKYYKITNVAKSMVCLLVKDEEIIDLSYKLFISILEFKNWIEVQLFEMQKNIESHDSLTNQFLKIIKDLPNNRTEAEELARQEGETKKGHQELIENYYKNRNNEYKKIIPIDNAFTDKVKKYLTPDNYNYAP